jgi:hypothetical protein
MSSKKAKKKPAARKVAAKKAVPKKPPGRPSKCTPAVVAAICERISQGEPMAQICRAAGMPAVRTVTDWMERDAGVFASIARARIEGFDAIAANVRLVARGLGESTMDVARDKLIIDTDLKLLSKWDPKRYGDRVDLEVKGDAVVRVVIGGDA